LQMALIGIYMGWHTSHTLSIAQPLLYLLLSPWPHTVSKWPCYSHRVMATMDSR